MMRRIQTAALASATLLGLGCSGPPAAENNAADMSGDMRVRPPVMTGPKWQTSVIDENGGGLHIQLATGGGKTAVAYFGQLGIEGGDCEEVGANATRVTWPLQYAETTDGGGSWSKETPYEPLHIGAPTGVDLDLDDAGVPSIATTTGEPNEMYFYCGANDMGVLTKTGGTWQVDVAAAESGDAAAGEAGSDFGGVVGLFPTMARDPQGNLAVAWKDVHAGSYQSDDRRRADLEFAWNQGGWSPQPVDFGAGAGNFNQLTFDMTGAPVIAYYVPTESLMMARQGIWVTRSTDQGQTWSRVQLSNLVNSQRPAILSNESDATLHVLNYHTKKGYPEFSTLKDLDKFEDRSAWETSDVGDSRYDEGYAPSIAISPDGRVAMAYYRCTKSTLTLGDCTVEDDALVFQYEQSGDWVREVVDEGEDAYCGQMPSLSFDAQGRAVIAYRCETVVDGSVVSQIKFARREVL